MSNLTEQLSVAARNAVFRRNWQVVSACSREILQRDSASAEGHFLAGLACKALHEVEASIASFEQALSLDECRYDAAIELANQYVGQHRHAEAAGLVARYEADLGRSPVYLNMAGTVCAAVGLHERAWPLFSKAHQLQPKVDLFASNLAASCVFAGRLDEARTLYGELLQRFPAHQRYHYQLSRIDKAADSSHIETMQRVLAEGERAAGENVFMNYAIGKELEDLERWGEAFEHFEAAGNAVAAVADYDVQDDIELLEAIMSACSGDWLELAAARTRDDTRRPVFVVGLPRSGTTLVERILTSHSQVSSVGETQYLPMTVRALSGLSSDRKMTPAMIEAAAREDIGKIRDGYLGRVGFRLGVEPYFVDKLPFNVLYLGFIARAFPEAKLVLLRRNPMDACFAMYKQVFTGSYKFSYTQASLARFYIAYRRLIEHWQAHLGARMTVVDYEELVSRPESATRQLLDALGLPFESACLRFEGSAAATATASAVQVRQRIHTQSVRRWRRYERQLQPLRQLLEHAGIETA